MPEPNLTAYDILGLTHDATSEDISQAYRQLAKMYHPDKADERNRSACEERMRGINAAYEILSNADNRLKYDELFSRPRTNPAREQTCYPQEDYRQSPIDQARNALKLSQYELAIALCRRYLIDHPDNEEAQSLQYTAELGLGSQLPDLKRIIYASPLDFRFVVLRKFLIGAAGGYLMVGPFTWTSPFIPAHSALGLVFGVTLTAGLLALSLWRD